MKKIWLTMIAIVFFGFVASSALAFFGGPMGGQMNGYYGNGDYQGFMTNTSQLRQDLAAKHGEYNALMASTNPDSKRAAELSRDIATLNDQLRTQAGVYNMQAPTNGYGYGRMGGYGMGMRGNMGGYGMGMMGNGCW
ncbi:MAG: hypothetical protein L3J69_02425 [Desulfobacula sp.]|nr:hypothetical protein [Desulfobacula sp.]